VHVGILGSGLVGGKLGTLFARAGHEVVFSYARSEQKLKRLARKVPPARVVAAFSTLPSEVLFSVFEARGKADPPSLVYCGDDEQAKALTARLIRDVGFDPVDAGPLRVARYTEPFSLLIAQLAYEGSWGPQLAYRFARFAQ
jgi:8-hydroxy-5-deazaflavin:NADPH oxidoreductase